MRWEALNLESWKHNGHKTGLLRQLRSVQRWVAFYFLWTRQVMDLMGVRYESSYMFSFNV